MSAISKSLCRSLSWEFLLSLFAFFVNLKGVPFAARIVRQVAMQTALYKLESPIEPGVFNTEINGYTIYVKDGDFERGTWKNIFIYTEEKNNKLVRLITSKSGRLDTTENRSELVLENAVVNTFSTENDRQKFVSESVGQIRYGIETKRNEMIEKLSSSEGSPEELGLSELSQLANVKEGREKREVQLLWQRRIILSVTPLIFALLGTALVLRFNRGGRGFGIFLALVSLVFYYLLTLLGEQIARTGQISVTTAGSIPLGVSFVLILWFYASNRFLLKKSISNFGRRFKFSYPFSRKKNFVRSRSYGLQTRILDLDIIIGLLKYFLLTLGFLTTIYMIFTAFELWKFAGEIDGGLILLGQYLFYLVPFIYIQLAPSALMIATLATYIIKSRQNEVVTWTSAGQSIYRLLVPCLALMFFFGGLNWGIQELILPTANQIQDQLRNRIRSRNSSSGQAIKNWVANDRRIYSFELDNENLDKSRTVKNLTVYEFSGSDSKLESVYKAPAAVWDKNEIKLPKGEKIDWSDGRGNIIQITNLELPENSNPFENLNEKPSHLNTEQTKERIKISESESEQRKYRVALEKKSTTLFLPLVITLFTAPFALSLSRQGKVTTIGYAVAVWLLFMGVNGAFEQFGLNGFVDPKIAIWGPLGLFAMLGSYLLSRIKT